MKVTFDKDALVAALIPATGIVPTRNTVAATEGLLFECPGDLEGTCRLSAYDMEKGMRTTLPARIGEPGKCILNAQSILQIARSLPDGNITIEVDEKFRAKISGGTSSFEIGARPGEDFPTMPLLSGDRYYVMPQHRLRTLITGVLFAVAQNDQRPAFNGAFLHVHDGILTLVGCDGNRLSIGNMPAPGGENAPNAEMIIPGRMLSEVFKLLRDTEDEVTIMLTRKHVIFVVGEICFFTRIIDVDYITYTRYIPQDYLTNVFLDTASLRGSIERASLITENKLGSNARTFVKLEFRDNEVCVSSVSDGGSVRETVPAAIDGNGVVIGFNCRYLLDILRACPAEMETLHLRLNSELMGMTIENGTSKDPDAAPSEEPEFTFFLMPVKMDIR